MPHDDEGRGDGWDLTQLAQDMANLRPGVSTCNVLRQSSCFGLLGVPSITTKQHHLLELRGALLCVGCRIVYQRNGTDSFAHLELGALCLVPVIRMRGVFCPMVSKENVLKYSRKIFGNPLPCRLLDDVLARGHHHEAKPILKRLQHLERPLDGLHVLLEVIGLEKLVNLGHCLLVSAAPHLAVSVGVKTLHCYVCVVLVIVILD
mmetsp:Transcript_7793/g.15942  ORF Transcript_7793/g.15942 Transcript_7793/m.15942 type:complete len:205 (+) Transcript_7793:1393-2007(+)